MQEHDCMAGHAAQCGWTPKCTRSCRGNMLLRGENTNGIQNARCSVAGSGVAAQNMQDCVGRARDFELVQLLGLEKGRAKTKTWPRNEPPRSRRPTSASSTTRSFCSIRMHRRRKSTKRDCKGSEPRGARLHPNAIKYANTNQLPEERDKI